MLTGSLVALVTPMREDGSVDLPQLEKLIDWHIANGTDALVIAGTTGESATLSIPEQTLVIETAVKHAAKRIPIVAGTGANNTIEAVELSQAAKKAGADATLSVVPYYNKPSQEGIYRHFKTIAETVDIPMIIYNVPGRTVVNMNNDTILRLAQIPNITGVKEASGALAREIDLINRAPEGFAVYSGDDPTALPHLFALAARTRAVIRQNLIWASVYNLIAVPLALAGFVTPWLAALGMSFSSLLVVWNALRLRR